MTNSLVLITNNENKSCSVGFVACKEQNYSYIVTCAHVVEGTSKSIFVDNVKAEILYKGSNNGLDVAVVKAKIDKEPLVLAKGECDDFEIISFKNFEENSHLPETINCQLDTKVQLESQSQEKILVWKLNINQSDVVTGDYSGSPLLCTKSGKVLAVVCNRKDDKEMFAISISHLQDIWEDMPKHLIASSSTPLKQKKPKKSINSWLKKYLLESVVGVIFLGILTNYLYDVLNAPKEPESKNRVKIAENNSSNATIELHNDANSSAPTKEIEFNKNKTQNSTIKVFQ